MRVSFPVLTASFSDRHRYTRKFPRPDNLLVVLGATTVGSRLLPLEATRRATTERRGESEVNVLLRVKADHEGRHVDDLAAHTDVALLDQDASVVDRLGHVELPDLGLEAALQPGLGLQLKNVLKLQQIEAKQWSAVCLILQEAADAAAHGVTRCVPRSLAQRSQLRPACFPQRRDRRQPAENRRLPLLLPARRAASGTERGWRESYLLLGVIQEAVGGQALEQRGALEQALRVLLVERQQHTGGLAAVGQLAVDTPDFLLGAEAVLATELQLVVEALLLIGTARSLGDRPVCAREAPASRSATGVAVG